MALVFLWLDNIFPYVGLNGHFVKCPLGVSPKGHMVPPRNADGSPDRVPGTSRQNTKFPR